MAALTPADVVKARLAELGADVRHLGNGLVVAYYKLPGWLPVTISLAPPTRTDPAFVHVRMDRNLSASDARQLGRLLEAAAEWRDAMAPHDPPTSQQGSLLEENR